MLQQNMSLQEIMDNVNTYWKEISKKYMPENIKVKITNFSDFSEGVVFKFELPHSNIHHFVPEFNISRADILMQNNFSWRRRVLLTVGKGIVFSVGNYEIDEAYDSNFCKTNHYGSSDLDLLHQDEDLLLEIGQALTMAANIPEFDQTSDPEYGLLEPFTDTQYDLLKVLYQRMTSFIDKQTDLVTFKPAFYAFAKSAEVKKWQLAELKFKRTEGKQTFSIYVFPNQVRKYERLFAKKGLGTDQAIYFIIKTLLKKEVSKYYPPKAINDKSNNLNPMDMDTLEEDKAQFLDLLNSMPKYFTELVK